MKSIVADAMEGKELQAFRLGDVIEQALEHYDEADVASETGWRYSAKKFLDAPVIEKLRSLITAIRLRRPPWEVYTASRRFYCLGGVLLRVDAHFEIDRTNEIANLLKFDSYSDEHDSINQ